MFKMSKRNGEAVPRAVNFGDLITADHKVLSDNCESRNNHRYAVVVQDLATQWIQAYPCKNKTSQETQRSLQKFLEPDRKPKVIYLDNSLEFGKSCEDLSWNHPTSTLHRSETNGIAERAVRRVKEGTSAVLLRSGLGKKWWADSMECYRYSAKYVCRTGTSASSTARAGNFLRDGTEEHKQFVKYTLDLLSIPNYYIKKGRPHGHRYGKKPGDHEHFIANSLKKKCKKRHFLGIHDRFIRDEKFRKNMIELGRSEEICREMDKLANEDHTHHITPDEIRVYRNNWWIRSNIVSSDTMPVRHRADFKQALTILRQLKNQEDTAYYQNWQSSSSSWWNWQESWWYSSSEHHRDDGPSTDRSGKPDGR